MAKLGVKVRMIAELAVKAWISTNMDSDMVFPFSERSYHLAPRSRRKGRKGRTLPFPLRTYCSFRLLQALLTSG